MVHDHEKLHNTQAGGIIAELVYGANDGIVTTFAVVASVAGAGLSPLIVIVLGLANLFADGFSMASGSYLSTKSRYDYEDEERKVEEMEIEKWPEEEIVEIREIYQNKGFKGELLEQVVKQITSDKKVWVDEMLAGELGIITEDRNHPFKNAVATFIAFVIAGFIPLVPYFFIKQGDLFGSALIMTAVALFAVGALSSRVTAKGWLFSGLQMLVVGGMAGAVAYLVGFIIKSVFGVVV